MMRAIAEPFFERSPYLLGPLFTLLLFFVVFIGVLLHVMRSKRLRFDDVSSLPLEPDGAPAEPSSPSRARRAS